MVVEVTYIKSIIALISLYIYDAVRLEFIGYNWY